MQVLLDNAPLPGTFDDVGAALDAAREKAEQTGRVIIEVVLDQRQLGSTELDSVCAGDSDLEGKELSFRSADPVALALTTVSQTRESLEEALRQQVEAGELLQSGDRGAAMQQLARPLEHWNAVYQAVAQVGLLLGIDFATFRVGKGSAHDIMAALPTRLRGIKAALVSGDDVALADELAYELTDAGEDWRRLLDALQAELEDRSA
jgi:hypothetical protein